MPRSTDERGKGGFWAINPDYADCFSDGIFKRKRKKKTSNSTARRAELNVDLARHLGISVEGRIACHRKLKCSNCKSKSATSAGQGLPCPAKVKHPSAQIGDKFLLPGTLHESTGESSFNLPPSTPIDGVSDHFDSCDEVLLLNHSAGPTAALLNLPELTYLSAGHESIACDWSADSHTDEPLFHLPFLYNSGEASQLEQASGNIKCEGSGHIFNGVPFEDIAGINLSSPHLLPDNGRSSDCLLECLHACDYSNQILDISNYWPVYEQ